MLIVLVSACGRREARTLQDGGGPDAAWDMQWTPELSGWPDGYQPPLPDGPKPPLPDGYQPPLPDGPKPPLPDGPKPPLPDGPKPPLPDGPKPPLPDGPKPPLPDGPKPPLPDGPVIKFDQTVVDNSTCAKAQDLGLVGTTPITLTGTTSTAQNEFGTSINCGSYSTVMSGPQRYYSMTLLKGQTYRMTLSPNFYNARLYLFTSCNMNTINTDCGSSGASGDVTPALYSGQSGSLTFTAPGTAIYRLAVDSTSPSYAGSYTLVVENYTPANNSTCAQAKKLTLSNGAVTVTDSTTGAQNEFGTGINCGSSSQTYPSGQLYYKVSMTAGKSYLISLKSSFYYAAFYLFPSAACSTNGINQGCGSKGSTGDVSGTIYSGQSGTVLFKPSLSGDYTIAVDGRYPQYTGNFDLSVEEYSPPANSTCQTATTLSPVPSGGKVTVKGSTSNLQNEFGTQIDCGQSYSMGGPQVYYSILLLKGKSYKITLLPVYTAWFYIFGNTCNPTTIDAQCGSSGLTGGWAGPIYNGGSGSLVFKPQATGAYRIAVDSYASTYAGAFTLTIEDVVLSPNGSCAAAKALTLTSGKVTVQGDTTGLANEFGTQITCGQSSFYAYDGPQLYYSATLLQGQTYKLSLSPQFYAGLYLWRGVSACNATAISSDCGSGGAQGSFLNVSSGTTGSLIFKPTSTGTYYLAVDSINTTYAGTFTLTLEQYTPPKNATCTAAQTITVAPGTATSISGDTTAVPNEFGTQINCGNYSTIFSGNQLYYKMVLSAGTTYSFTLTPAFNYARFYLFDGSCQPTSINSDCGSNGSTGAVSAMSYINYPTTVTFKPVKSGIYHLAVDSTYSTAYGAFKLDIK